ncbi:MAG: hypothetical protein BM563_04850 [Bacteroidetes bacterium MedPE-SWsnd-G1]|nr:MAG: hypothetical protein BM563_04850 [Bacteroidetes bacterium MedPE-SWsnd-G1]
MKLITKLCIFFFCFCSFAQQNWLKGNLHTHSLWSDGDDFPEMIIKWYKDNGYQFVAISDHNTIADEIRWIKMKDREVKNKTLLKYKTTFGDWVEAKDSLNETYVRLKTYKEYKNKMETVGKFTIIKSEEVTSSFQKKPIHINVSNLQEYIPPFTGNSVVEVMQKTLDHVHEQREKTNTPMIAHINHPNFGYGITAEDMKKLTGEQFFEVYNGHPAVHNEGDHEHMSIEEMWDIINVSYYKQGKPLLYGIGTDDSHHYHKFAPELSNTGRGWIMVNTIDNEPNAIITAMEKGLFYASSGVTLSTVSVSKSEYSIAIEKVPGNNYEIIFYGLKKGTDKVIELSKTSGTNARYSFQNNDVFVRAKINSTYKIKNPYKEGETAQAWTQPVLLK